MIEKIKSFLDHVFWGYPKTSIHIRMQSVFFIILFFSGVIYWVYFFNSGILSLTAYDWIKEDAYLNTLRLAQTNNQIPWQWGDRFFHGIDKFLVNPEVVLTPDIILLRWISNGSFIVFHTILFYSVGFLGSLIIARKLNARFVAFSIFWLLFNFNGYLTAHIGVGHFEWTGYFLIPFFFIILFKFAEKKQKTPLLDITSVLWMALLFGCLFLNGSFHIAIWCSIFMSIALLWRWTMLPSVFTSILFGIMLGFGRLLPAALWFPKKSAWPLGSGYPTFGTFLDALTGLRLYDFPGIQGVGWWEYDIYIGFVAFAILLISLAVALKQNKIPYQPFLFIVACFFIFLSLGNVYFLITKLPIPFVGIERVSSRFIVLPFILFLITAMSGVGEMLSSWEKNTKTLLFIGLPIVAGELLLHSFYWRVTYIEQSFKDFAKPMISLVPCSDLSYIALVYASWTVSLISLIIVVAVLFRELYTNRSSLQTIRV